MHGEYKTPGGKLIVVDFQVRDGALSGVMVSGDFFLYPEDALSDLTTALEGVSVELTESEIAEKVRFGLRREAQLLGSSPEGIATAVRRALAPSTVSAGGSSHGQHQESGS
jgi:lipoate-protein ligase A